MRISDWSSDVCSSDLGAQVPARGPRDAGRRGRLGVVDRGQPRRCPVPLPDLPGRGCQRPVAPGHLHAREERSGRRSVLSRRGCGHQDAGGLGMTWMHWILFGLLSLFAISVATAPNTKTKTRLAAFVFVVGLVLLLVLGQPK